MNWLKKALSSRKLYLYLAAFWLGFAIYDVTVGNHVLAVVETVLAAACLISFNVKWNKG